MLCSSNEEVTGLSVGVVFAVLIFVLLLSPHNEPQHTRARQLAREIRPCGHGPEESLSRGWTYDPHLISTSL